ncbi:MAG: hypothetical protein ACRDZ5_10025 [Acidimicrobiales bacterium]
MPATSVHFNGSVNLPDPETVMREISTRIPAGVRRMTEGETGDRNYWIFFQQQKFAATAQFEPTPPPQGATGDYEQIPHLRLAPGVSPSEVVWPDIGYANAYADSYETFRRLQDEGIIPSGVRFQLEYPTPLAAMSMIDPGDQRSLLDSYETALFTDLGQAVNTLAHGEIAVQWDVAVEIGLLAGGFGPAQPYDAVVPGLTRCIDQAPDDVPTGMHLCYGDYQHHHFAEPESLDLQVGLVNALSASARRPVSWFSFTVPQDRADDSYFAPLRDLQTGPETELAFALVPYHPEQQAAGTTTKQANLIDTHLAHSSGGARDWAICTECGMGRVERGDVPRLLDLHREILSASS